MNVICHISFTCTPASILSCICPGCASREPSCKLSVKPVPDMRATPHLACAATSTLQRPRNVLASSGKQRRSILFNFDTSINPPVYFHSIKFICSNFCEFFFRSSHGCHKGKAQRVKRRYSRFIWSSKIGETIPPVRVCGKPSLISSSGAWMRRCSSLLLLESFTCSGRNEASSAFYSRHGRSW